MSKKRTKKKLLHYLKPFRWQILFVVLFVVTSCSISIGLSYLNGLPTTKIASNLKNHEAIDFSYIKNCVIVMIVLACLYFLTKFIAGYVLTDVVQQLMFQLRTEIQDKLNKLPVSYFDTTKQGDVLSRVTNDVDTLSNALQQSFIAYINALLMILMSSVMMVVINWKLGLMVLISIPITILLSRYMVKISQPSYDTQQKTLADMNAYVQENVTGFSVLKLYGREQETLEGFKEINEKLTKVGGRAVYLSGLMNTFANFITYYFVYLLAVLVGARFVIQGEVLVGQLQSFIYYIYSVSQPISQMTQLMAVLQSAFSALNRLFEFLDEKEEMVHQEEMELEEVVGEVVFDHVGFEYRKDTPLIQDFQLSVEPGEMVAVVGPTGAGKTTLINLIERFYDVTEGRILVDGRDIRKISRKSFRSEVGMVLQDAWLYEGTIRENIRFGKLNAADEEVEEAGRLAKLDGFIAQLPNGYDTMIDAEANNISLGQKQLITIARALISDPKILILDEATSSVDTSIEKLIQEAMSVLLKGKTSFVIAHRLSTIRNANKILVMHHGKIVEHGRHEELLEKKGFYYELYHSQFVGEE